MPQKKIKIAVIIGGILAGGGIIFLIKSLKNSRTSFLLKNEDSAAGSPAAEPIKATSSVFPLKNGSPQNNLVKQLQTYLGVSADGLFGPKTAAALLAYTGKTQIKNQAEYDLVIKQLQAKSAVSSSSLRANDLTSKYKSSSTAQLATIAKTTIYGVSKDVYGALHATGKELVLGANLKLNRADYTPIGSTTNGFLLFTINTGESAGMYKGDANKFTIV